MQQTLKNSFVLRGIGLHSGADLILKVSPAPAGHGIVFSRTDVTDKNNIIPALWDNVEDTTLCTVLSNHDNVSVRTVEHLMAALRGCHIDNAFIEIDGPEIPSLDGSSQFFVKELEKTGVRTQSAPRKAIRILKEVRVQKDDKMAVLSPSILPKFSGMIEYDHPLIGQQRYTTTLVNGNFAHELAATRSFCLYEDIEAMRAKGLIKGGSLDNAVVLEGERVLNPGGLRFDDEFVRHKILDAIGDLYLAGAPIIGAYYGERCGHEMNNLVLRALFADSDAYEWVDHYMDIEDSRSGHLLSMARRPVHKTGISG